MLPGVLKHLQSVATMEHIFWYYQADNVEAEGQATKEASQKESASAGGARRQS